MNPRSPKGNKELDALDNQGVCFLIDEVKAKTDWENRENE